MLTLRSYTNQNVLSHTMLDTLTPVEGVLDLTALQHPVVPADTPAWLLPVLTYGATHPVMWLDGAQASGFTVELVSYTAQNVASGQIGDTHTVLGHFEAGQQVHIDLGAAEQLLMQYSGPVTPIIQYALDNPQFRLVITPDAAPEAMAQAELIGVPAPLMSCL
jgi:hypothetical protein